MFFSKEQKIKFFTCKNEKSAVEKMIVFLSMKIGFIVPS